LFKSSKMFSHTSFSTIEYSKRVGGGETVIVSGWRLVWVEELGASMFRTSTVSDKVGSKNGGSWTDSRTKGADESKVVLTWISCSSSVSESAEIVKWGSREGSWECWESIVAFEDIIGNATMIGCTSWVCSSNTKSLASDTVLSCDEDSCVSRIGESGLVSGCCCWGLSETDASWTA
jgi:hypothetical protein